MAPAQASSNVLVVGVVPSLTWSVARALMRAGHRACVLGAHRVSPMQALPGMHYVCWHDVRWFNRELDPTLVEQVEHACRQLAIDCVVPADYPAAMLLSDYGYGVRSARVAAVPRAVLLRRLHHRWELSKTLMRLGLPQPRTELALDAPSLASTQLPFPIITKSAERFASGRCQVHHDRDQLEQRIVLGALAADYPLIVQEFIPGQDVGFAFLARHGELVAHAAFEQTVRGSRRYFDAPRLRQHVATLLRETGYHGVGEIDTRYDRRTDEYRLLEVNPRFWASVLYAARAGVNFPDLLMQLDDLPVATSFSAQIVPVRLSAYEGAAARSVRLVEDMYNSMLRRRNG